MAVVVKKLPDNAGDIREAGLIPKVRKIPWRRAWQPCTVKLNRDSDFCFFLLLHRCRHQELLQKDWLQIARSIHGKDPRITPHQSALRHLLPGRKQIQDVLKTQHRGWAKQMDLPEPLAGGSPSRCSLKTLLRAGSGFCWPSPWSLDTQTSPTHHPLLHVLKTSPVFEA